eukprot:Gb_00304 [translate_table: standard]
MWQFLLLAAAGTGYLARCFQTSSKRRFAPPKDEEKESKACLTYRAIDSLRSPNDSSLTISQQSCLDAQFRETYEEMASHSVNPVEMQYLRNGKSARVELAGLTGEQCNHKLEDCQLVTQPSWNPRKREDLPPTATQCIQDVKELQLPNHGSNRLQLCNIEHFDKRYRRKKIVSALQKRGKMPQPVEDKNGASGLVGHKQTRGGLLFSYGVGVGVMFMISSGKCEIDKLTAVLNQTVDLVKELKAELDGRKKYSQNNRTSGGSRGIIDAYQEENLDKDAKYLVQKDAAGFAETPFQALSEDSESDTSVITEEAAQQVTEIAELEADLQAELENIQVNMTEGNIKHRRKISGLSELDPDSLVDVVDGELYLHWLPDHCDSVNKTPPVQLVHCDLDNNGVSPYELDRHLRDLLEKQQEEKILELEAELKSTETRLRTKEQELQQWKDHVRCLTELSFGATSGEDSMSFERTNDADGGQHIIGASMKGSAKSILNSEQAGNSQLPPWPLSHLVENPLESTADSPEHLDQRRKMPYRSRDATRHAYVENVKRARSIPDFRASTDETCMDFLQAVADARSDMFCHHSDGICEQNIEQECAEGYDKASEASSSSIVLDNGPDWKAESDCSVKNNNSEPIINEASESLGNASSTQRLLFQNKSGFEIKKFEVNARCEGFGCSVNEHQANWAVSVDSHNVYNCSDGEGVVHVAESCKEPNPCMSNLSSYSSLFCTRDLEIDSSVLDKVNSWEVWNSLQ